MELKDNPVGVGEALHRQRTGVKKVFPRFLMISQTCTKETIRGLTL